VAVLAAIVICVPGCGGGVSSGATVNVYVGAPLCAAAKRELARQRGEAGDLEVSVVCLGDAEAGGRLDLAAIGADARRASEDSASVAYVEAPGPGNRFSRPIVEEAGIAYLTAGSGAGGGGGGGGGGRGGPGRAGGGGGGGGGGGARGR
jgi:hypothetical protein